MNTKIIAATIGLTALLSTGAATAAPGMTHHEPEIRAGLLQGGHDRNLPNPVAQPMMKGKAAYGMPTATAQHGAGLLQGGHDRNLPNATHGGMASAGSMTAAPNNAGYDLIPGPLDQ